MVGWGASSQPVFRRATALSAIFWAKVSVEGAESRLPRRDPSGPGWGGASGMPPATLSTGLPWRREGQPLVLRRRPDMAIEEVVVHHSKGLHRRVHGRGADEAEAEPAQLRR